MEATVLIVDDHDEFRTAARASTGWRWRRASPRARDPRAVVLTASRDAASYGPRLARTTARGFIQKSELSGAGLARLVAR